MVIGTFALGILVGVAIAAISAYRVKKKKAREKASAVALDSAVESDVE